MSKLMQRLKSENILKLEIDYSNLQILPAE